jgi:hypothetical protein
VKAGVLALGAALAVAPGAAGAWSFEPGGSLRHSLLAVSAPLQVDVPPLLAPLVPAGLDEAGALSETRLRPTLRAATAVVEFELAVEGTLSTGSGGVALLGAGGASSLLGGTRTPYADDPLAWTHIEDTGLQAATRIERLVARVALGPLDLAVGRQPVGLGTSHFISVLDVVAPFAPGALDATFRPGVDAARLRSNLGMHGEAELITVAADPLTEGTVLGRIRVLAGPVDFELLGGRFGARNFGGLGWEGEAGPVGLWGEAALFERNEPRRAGPSRVAMAVVAGLDVRLPGRVDLGLGGHYSDFGARRPADLAVVAADRPFREGWVFLAGAGHGLVTLARELHPLVQGSVAGLISLIDGSTLWQPRLTVSVADNADLTLFGWISAGPRPSLGLAAAGGLPSLALHQPSEFGAVPDGGGLYARWFF